MKAPYTVEETMYKNEEVKTVLLAKDANFDSESAII